MADVTSSLERSAMLECDSSQAASDGPSTSLGANGGL